VQAQREAEEAEDLRQHSITEELCEFVSGLTYSTFRSVSP
jgi:hypothetical protein